MRNDLDLDVLATAGSWRDDGLAVALATVARTWGSAPRPAGSHMAINERGEFAGSVSGGCIEAAVVAGALDVIGSGAPRRLEFGVSDESAWNIGLACGGRVVVFIERLD